MKKKAIRAITGLLCAAMIFSNTADMSVLTYGTSASNAGIQIMPTSQPH